jgi:hypothetical protein
MLLPKGDWCCYGQAWHKKSQMLSAVEEGTALPSPGTLRNGFLKSYTKEMEGKNGGKLLNIFTGQSSQFHVEIHEKMPLFSSLNVTVHVI